ncbi:O-antigen ligase family protein [bacterium]
MFIFTAVMFTALICTQTRSSWLGLFAGFVVWLFFYLKNKTQNFKFILKVTAIIILLTSAVILLSPAKGMIKERVKESFSFKHENKAIFQRILIWSCAKDIFLEKPVLGAGWGLFEMRYPFYQGKYLFDERIARHRTHANNVHNEILEQLSQVGIIGLGIFIWLLICFWKLMLNIFYDAKLTESRRMESVVLLSGSTAMLVDNMFNVSLHFAVPMMIFWFMIGTGVKKFQWFKKESKKVEYNITFVYRLLIMLLIFIFLSISVKQIKMFLAEKNYFKGFVIAKKKTRIYKNDLLVALKYFEKARSQHRFEVNNLYEMGNTFAQLGVREKAKQFYLEAISANPGYDEIYFNLGVMFYQDKDIPNALKNFETSYKINPIETKTLYALSNIYLLKKECYDKGIEVLTRAVKIDNFKNASGLNNLGFLYGQKGGWDKAMFYYKKAIAADPNFTRAKQNIEEAKRNIKGKPVKFQFDSRP